MATVTSVPPQQRRKHGPVFWVLLSLLILVVVVVAACALFWVTASPSTQGTIRIFIDTLLGRGGMAGQ